MSSFLIACPSARGRIYGEIVAQPLLPHPCGFVLSFFFPIYQLQEPLSQVLDFFHWAFFLCSYKCGVSSRGGECRSLPHCHFEQEPFLFHPCKQIIGHDPAYRNRRLPCVDSLKFLLNSCQSQYANNIIFQMFLLIGKEYWEQPSSQVVRWIAELICC